MPDSQDKLPKKVTGKAAKARQLLTGLLALLILILIAGMWYSNKILSSQVEQVASTKAKADAEDSKYSTLLSTQAKLKQLGDLPSLAQQALPLSDNQSFDIAELNKFASDNGVNLTSIVFNDNSKKATDSTTKLPPGVESVGLSIQAENMSYNQLLGFLRAIETNRHLMQPTNINITPDNSGSAISQLTLGVNVYYMQ